MSYIRRPHFPSIVAFASSAMLLLGSPVLAQTVSVFDDAPSIEQLRGIMIPESRPGLGRSIVIQQPNIAASSPAIQRVSTDIQTPSRAPVAAPRTSPTAVVQASVPIHAPKPESKPADKAGIVAFHVNFDFNSAVLPDSAHEMIDLIAQLMKESPDIKVRVEGHTDAVGSVSYNVSLSERRAISVGEYLIKQGVDPSHLTLAGKGMAEPLARNKYDPANRRVQFVRLG